MINEQSNSLVSSSKNFCASVFKVSKPKAKETIKVLAFLLNNSEHAPKGQDKDFSAYKKRYEK